MRPDLWLRERWKQLGPRVRLAAAGTLVILVAAGSVAGYRQYHYMMHDNEFCLSCHLMTNAYDRFQRSVHNRLSCHTCHPAGPSTVWQLYATVFLNPTAVKKHAHVPNKTCAGCHVRGDPAKWRIIATTAGHRIHLESTSPVLRDIQCVTCHSYSVHEFSPNNQTCLEARCHPDARIRLGRMSGRDIYCTTCHNFTAEAPTLTYDSLGEPLSPKAQQCYACHEMREALQNMEFTHDPHRGECGMCHNPHRQTTKQDAAATCASGRCHQTWRSSSFHVGVPNPEQCTRCHLPHSWKVEGRNCLRCHENVTQDRPARRRPASMPATGTGAAPHDGGTW